MYKYLSLFSGIGGFELGIQQAYELQKMGTEPENSSDSSGGTSQHSERPLCIGYSEIDKYAIQIYERHFKHKNYGDITTINATELPDFDFLCGGFPCQSFSIAGKRGGFNDTRGTLFFDIARIVKEKQPRLLLLENVKGLLSHDNGQTFKTIISTLTELGYDLQWQVLNSKNFGVPQNRERVFIVGHFRGTSRPEVFPIVGKSEEDNRTVGQEISYTIDANYAKGTNTLNKSRRQVIRQPLKFMNRNQKNIIGDYAYTVDSLNTGGIKENSRIRRLTPIECERLQGFPDGWTEGISDTQRYKTLGNAVTVNVIIEIMKRLWN